MRVRRSCWLLASCASCVLGCAHGAPTAPAAASVGEIGPAAVEEDQHPSDGVLRYTGVLEEGDRVIPDDGSWADDYDVEAQAAALLTSAVSNSWDSNRTLCDLPVFRAASSTSRAPEINLAILPAVFDTSIPRPVLLL